MALTPIDCEDIIARFAAGESQAELAWQFDVTISTISRVVRGITCGRPRGRRPSMPPLWPGADKLRFEEDAIAQAVVWECAPLTLEQVGAIIGVTRERVRQIEQNAFLRIRRHHGDDVLLELLAGWAEVREMRAAREGVAA